MGIRICLFLDWEMGRHVTRFFVKKKSKQEDFDQV